MLRGGGEQEKLLKNAKTQFTAEQEEISTYLALEVFAKKVGDSETAKLARDIRKEEERMAKFLEGEIRQLATATALEEVPAGQRRSAGENAARRKNAPRETEKSARKRRRKKPRRKTARKSGAEKTGRKSEKNPGEKRAGEKTATKAGKR